MTISIWELWKISGCYWFLLILLRSVSSLQLYNETIRVVPEYLDFKACLGSSRGRSTNVNNSHLTRLKADYENCTHIVGNLELTYIPRDLDLNFLNQIREVSGYVIISEVDKESIELPNLRIIRGNRRIATVDNSLHFSLLVINNSRLRKLGLFSLRGDVLFFHNPLLCHANSSVNWSDILSMPGKQTFIARNSANTNCPSCSADCTHPYCWGETINECQTLSKWNCADKCHDPGKSGRCYGSNRDDRECCSSECVGGCTGPDQFHCTSCRNWQDNGQCVSSCPPLQQTIKGKLEPLLTGKYKYEKLHICIKQCPEFMLRENGHCVELCGTNTTEHNGECVPCKGNCPKVCYGFSEDDSVQMITNVTIRQFIDCVIVNGSLVIHEQSFKMDSFIDSNHVTHGPVNPGDLEKFLSTIRQITGFLRVDGSHKNMTSLSFLRNLEVINGRNTEQYYHAAITILRSENLENLGLTSLHSIGYGNVLIAENKELSYADSINWTSIIKPPFQLYIRHNKPTARSSCTMEGRVCDTECSADGCWDPGPDSCVSCINYKFNQICLNSCYIELQSGPLFNAGNQLCESCDFECSGPCMGKGPENWTRCKNFKHDNRCVSSCPRNTHPISVSCSGSECDWKECELDDYMGESIQRILIVVASCTGIFIIAICILLGFYCYRSRRKVQPAADHREEDMLVPDRQFTPRRLKTINENELRRRPIPLHRGNFGEVFEGVWVPFGRNVKIPVAIKVLIDGRTTVAETLEEAKFMATVDHPYLVSLLGICMTSPVVIVTPLMPLGCLRKYVQSNERKIGSKLFLTWCTQIAKAMEYLEKRKLIHGDLAARNILVQSPKLVKVSGFGWTKMLDLNPDIYTRGGMVPFKWLAPECMKDHIYSSKTDVWAFGVTIWELFSYGCSPYQSLKTSSQVKDFVTNGDRLKQPSICSIDTYMLLLKCWHPHAKSRPSFEELASEFTKMSKNPGGFLHIPGDKYLWQLPQYTKQDQHGMLDVDDVPEELVMADDYVYRFGEIDACYVNTRPEQLRNCNELFSNPTTSGTVQKDGRCIDGRSAEHPTKPVDKDKDSVFENGVDGENYLVPKITPERNNGYLVMEQEMKTFKVTDALLEEEQQIPEPVDCDVLANLAKAGLGHLSRVPVQHVHQTGAYIPWARTFTGLLSISQTERLLNLIYRVSVPSREQLLIQAVHVDYIEKVSEILRPHQQQLQSFQASCLTSPGAIFCPAVHPYWEDCHERQKIYKRLIDDYAFMWTVGEGHCLFHAASWSLFGHQDFHVHLRLLTIQLFCERWEYFLSDAGLHLSDHKGAALIHSTAQLYPVAHCEGSHLKAIAITTGRRVFNYAQLAPSPNACRVFDNYTVDQINDHINRADGSSHTAYHPIPDIAKNILPLCVFYVNGDHYEGMIPRTENVLVYPVLRRPDIQFPRSGPNILIDSIVID